MFFKSAVDLSKDLIEKRVSCEELVSSFMDRIELVNPIVNAIISFNRDKALEKARSIDNKRFRKGETLSRCAGLPIIHKDVLCTRDFPTTCGSRMLKDFVSPYDAHVVSILDKKGLVTLGKSNMDEFAMGTSNENSFFGPVRNPWDLDRVPGGSSGGAAVVISAGLAPFSTGTDTGGSVRQPAALTGVTALKPTYGLVSRYGLVAFASSFDQAGPMTRSVADCAFLLQEMVDHDSRDSTQSDRPLVNYFDDLMAQSVDLSGITVGVVKEFFPSSLDADVRSVVEAAIDELRRMGAKVKGVSLPRVSLSVPLYYVLSSAEAASNMARFDGVRYGFRSTLPFNSLEEFYSNTRGEGFGYEVKRRILTGNFVLSSKNYERYYLRAQKIRRLVSQEIISALSSCDILAGPTSPTVAFRMGEEPENAIDMYFSDIFTIPANLAGLPAISIPCGFSRNLPVGLQLISKQFGESRLFHAGHAFQCCTDHHERVPNIVSQNK
ncbi:Asp-tRNA(Asn)/Glu-tRNA(Gln) amidotransferase subunit GatA [Candidatus Ichthyocystis hellenicum]|uniref:Asp-tRNA(Asn)/Glu-tRNA(Gln) amidotransferase subunit GatA n=1 Tax=Candidatus Ichthyocystis hellenicum TaxID=1561003 RepID=UPI000B88CF37|nr:Asp-tRNA(Asn)/Glu-tRNA(Gln) amidotransferase subunit GatA [Candidatus Ichthyocystis hellenicum]